MNLLEELLISSIEGIINDGSEEFKNELCSELDRINFIDEYFVVDEIVNDRIAEEVAEAKRETREQMWEQFKEMK